MVIGHKLVAEDTADIALFRLAGKDISGSPGQGRVFTPKTVHFHQQPQGPVGLEQVVFGTRSRMVGLSGVAPGTIGLLPVHEAAGLRQFPERFERANRFFQQIALDEENQGRVRPGPQSR
jgi:hypothetical protein